MEELTIEKAIDILESIPIDKFIVHSFSNGVDSCCSAGHLRRFVSSDPNNYSIDNIVCDNTNYIISKFYQKYNITSLSAINDIPNYIGMDYDNIMKYYQTNPKERVLAYLKDIKKEYESKH